MGLFGVPHASVAASVELTKMIMLRKIVINPTGGRVQSLTNSIARRLLRIKAS